MKRKVHFLNLVAVFAACACMAAAPCLSFTPMLAGSSRTATRPTILIHLSAADSDDNSSTSKKSLSRLGGRKMKKDLRSARKNQEHGDTKTPNFVVAICFAIPLLLGFLSWQSDFGGEVYYFESSSFTKTVVNADGRVIETTRQESQRMNMGRPQPRLLNEDPGKLTGLPDEVLSYEDIRRMFLNDLDSFF